MTQKELNDERVLKKQDYRERHRFWTGETLNQFGSANNFFIIAGFAMLGYFLTELDEIGRITFCFNETYKRASLLTLSAAFTTLSLVCGTITLLSRLYDLRLTRHINMIRIKAYNKKYGFKKFNSEYIDIRKETNYFTYAMKLIWKFIGTLTSNKYFLKDSTISDENVNTKFWNLRQRTLMLGSLSWMSFGWQIFWIFVAILCYINIWIK